METKNLLNKKITQWLLLVAMLVGCSVNAWAADCGSTDVTANTTIYVDASYVSGDFSNVYLSLVCSDNEGKAGSINKSDVSGMTSYKPSSDKWDYKTYTAKNGNIYTFKITSDEKIYGIAIWAGDLSNYGTIWQTKVSATCDFQPGGTYTIKTGSTHHNDRQSDGYTGTWESSSPCDGYSVPSKVLDGSNVMCYISQPWDNMFLTYCSTGEVGSHTRINSTNAIVTKDAKKDSYKIGISNSSSWPGACMDEQSDALLMGSYYVADGNHNVTRTAATELTTFTLSSESITEGTASITMTLKNDKTTSSYDNRPIKNLIYVDDVMVDCADGSTSDINKTLNTSSWEIGDHEIKIILTDGTIYYIGGTQTITVTSACTPPTKDQYTMASQSVDYTGSAQKPTINVADGAGSITKIYGSTNSGSTWTDYGTSGPINAGTYMIKIDCGAGTTYCASTSSIVLDNTFTINKINQSALTFSGSTQCVGTSVTLSATGGSSGQTIKYEVKSGTGTISGSTLTTSTAGNVVVTATRPGGTNYNDVTADATFTFTAKPTAYNVSGTESICTGSSTNVTLANSQTGYTYKLYKDGSATSTTQTGATGSALKFSVSEAGTYTIKGYVTDNESCSTDMSGNAEITIKNATVTTSPALDNIHPYEVVTLTANKAVTWNIAKVPTGVVKDKNAYFPWESTEQGTASIRFKGAKGNEGGYRLTATTTDGCVTNIEFNVILDSEDCH